MGLATRGGYDPFPVEEMPHFVKSCKRFEATTSRNPEPVLRGAEDLFLRMRKVCNLSSRPPRWMREWESQAGLAGTDVEGIWHDHPPTLWR